MPTAASRPAGSVTACQAGGVSHEETLWLLHHIVGDKYQLGEGAASPAPTVASQLSYMSDESKCRGSDSRSSN